MLSEFLMHTFGWTDCWYAHPSRQLYGASERWGKTTIRQKLQSLRIFITWRDRFHVGVWTGRDGDLICVKQCSTNEEAERYLAPGSSSLVMAAARSAWKRLWLDAKLGCPTNIGG